MPAGNWLANFAVAQAFPILIGSIGRPATFWIYAGLRLLAIVAALKQGKRPSRSCEPGSNGR